MPWRHLLLITITCLVLDSRSFAAEPASTFPQFKVEEIDTGLKIGYAVITTDIDGDGKPDIVVVDQHKVVWYQNPTWKKRVILDGQTKPDNVCIAALDIDGDKLPELIVGAAWKPFDTKTPGTLQWLRRGKTLDDAWTMHTIPCDEPTVHRIRIVPINTVPHLILAPLMGRDATKDMNWVDGRPVRIMAYPIPKQNPEKPESWKPFAINQDLHVVHNMADGDGPEGDESLLYATSYAGLHQIRLTGKLVDSVQIGIGNQAKPNSNRGASEVALGKGFDEKRRSTSFAATIEPWHGNELVVYRAGEKGKLWERTVLDDHLRWGHAVKCANMTVNTKSKVARIGPDEVIVGVRDNPDPKQGDQFTEKRGVRVYRFDTAKKKWDRQIIEDGGVAVEDLVVADLNDDGWLDIVAVGRATGNCRIYFNQGMPK